MKHLTVGTTLALTAAGFLAPVAHAAPGGHAVSAPAPVAKALKTYPYRHITLEPERDQWWIDITGPGGRHAGHAVPRTNGKVDTYRTEADCDGLTTGQWCPWAWQVTRSEVRSWALWKPKGITKAVSCVLVGTRDGSRPNTLNCDGHTRAL